MFTGPALDPEPLRKAIALSEEKYCGVRATLAADGRHQP